MKWGRERSEIIHTKKASISQPPFAPQPSTGGGGVGHQGFTFDPRYTEPAQSTFSTGQPSQGGGTAAPPPPPTYPSAATNQYAQFHSAGFGDFTNAIPTTIFNPYSSVYGEFSPFYLRFYDLYAFSPPVFLSSFCFI